MEHSLKVVVGPTLREQVTAKLRNAIASGQFHPGERLVERRLCELTGVSRPSIREALRELEGDGLITSVPNRGLVVAVVSESQARSIYEVRAVLEALIVRLFSERADEAAMSQFASVAEKLDHAYEGGDAQAIFTAKNAFYKVLLDGCGNDVATQMLRSIHTRVSQLRMTSLADPGRAARSAAEIRGIVGAVKARKADEAARLSTTHVENAAATALAVLRRRQAEHV